MWVILSPAQVIKGEDFCPLAPCFTHPFYSVFAGGSNRPPVPARHRTAAPGYRGGALQSSKERNTDRF